MGQSRTLETDAGSAPTSRYRSGPLVVDLISRTAGTKPKYAIPRRVGNAVVRNKIRRRLRALSRELNLAQAGEIVVRVRQDLSFQQARTNLSQILEDMRVQEIP